MALSSNSRGDTRAFYDEICRVYDSLAEGSEGPIKQNAVRRMGVVDGEHILEVGCGTGHALVSLAKAAGPSGRVFGADLSEGMLACSREAIERADVAPLAGLVCADATHLPFRDACLDGIFMSFTLELFDSLEAPLVLLECLRVLKPGGRISIAAVSTEGQHGVAFEIYEWTHRHFPKVVDCRPIALAKLLESAGFTIKDRLLTTMWVPVEIVLAEAKR